MKSGYPIECKPVKITKKNFQSSKIKKNNQKNEDQILHKNK